MMNLSLSGRLSVLLMAAVSLSSLMASILCSRVREIVIYDLVENCRRFDKMPGCCLS